MAAITVISDEVCWNRFSHRQHHVWAIGRLAWSFGDRQGKRELINPLLDEIYGGTANADSWSAEGINATLARSFGLMAEMLLP